MEKKMLVYTTLLAAFLSLVIFGSFNSEENKNHVSEKHDSTSFQQYVTGFDLNKTFEFAGEPMPTENFDPVERLDRELSVNAYMHATTLLHIKTANRYFPVIEPILRKNGIPEDFKYLCVAESSLRMATSSAGAKGLWQFVEHMGRAYNLEISEDVDERYHVEKSTEAACQFLLYLKNRFGSWTMAAAAYNMGETALAKRIQDQKSTNYYDLNLNDETSRYVFRIMAIKEIMQHPEQYGFNIPEDQLYEPHDYKTLSISQPIPSLGEFAQQQGTTFRLLKVFNPWLLSNSLKNPNRKTYEIRIPQ
ncbi:MAG TPA: lytic transglycosylase domain-containing protein [Saprospiraceae bacterium]|nr:lytic transglycosylase domain-containing protein [Saprospiraceae bacterium]